MQRRPLPELVFYFFLFPFFVFLLILKINALQSIAGNQIAQETLRQMAQTQKNMPEFSFLWAGLSYSISFGLLAFLLLWRSRQRKIAYVTCAGFIFLSISELAPLGSHEILTGTFSPFDFVLSVWGSFGVGLIMYFVLHLPEELPAEKRLSPWWAYAVFFIDGIVRGFFFFDVSVGSVKASEWIWGGDVLVATAFIFVLGYNYAASPPLGRRRGRWIIYASIIGNLPWLIGGFCGWLLPAFSKSVPWEYIGSFTILLLPMGFLLSLLSDDLMQVDGPSKVAIVFVSFVLLVALAIQLMVPWFAQLLYVQLAVRLEAGRFVLSILSAVLLCAMAIKFYPRTLSYFLPEQRFVTDGVRRVQLQLDASQKPEGMLSQFGQVLDELLEPERWLVFRRNGDVLHLCADSDPNHGMPMEMSHQDLMAHPPEKRVFLHLQMLIPSHPIKVLTLFIQPKEGLAWMLWLGPKRSRTPYTEQEVEVFQSMVKLIEDLMRAQIQQEAMDEQLRWMSDLQASHAAVLREQKQQASQFAGLNHDLKQPLEAIRLLSEMLEERATDEQSQSLLRELHGSALSLRSMLHESLDQAKRRALNSVPVGVNFQLKVLGERLAPLFSSQAAQKGLSFDLDFQEHMVHTDPQLLERILLNLLSNAVRYTEAGHVKGATREEGEFVIISVEDTGLGFEAGTIAEASSEWSQLESGSKDGHGLGLSIIHQLVEHLALKLDVASTPKQGSVFRLYVPKAIALENPPSS